MDGKVSYWVQSAIDQARKALKLFEKWGTTYRYNEEDYRLFHMQINQTILEKWYAEVTIDHEEVVLPTVCLCEDRESRQQHMHLLVYSPVPDTYYWEIRKIMGIPREAIRRTRIGSRQHAFNTILYFNKKYGSGKALPNTGRFGHKTCTRKWRSTEIHGLQRRPITNDEHALCCVRAA